MAGRFSAVVAAVIVSGLVVLACEASLYTVGNAAGWDISADLPSWAAGKLFYTGDVLLFTYSQYHSVNIVDKNGFDSCNASNAFQRSTGGNTSVALATAGEKYFICGVLSHCLGGMKLRLHVSKKVTAAAAPSLAPELSPVVPSSLPTPASINNGADFPQDNGSSKSLRICNLLPELLALLVCVYILRMD
ncbi:Uclacyanin-2 [Platanthera guangdongensis]|uniref:Uclacyanin-2 n=1 Tax=Platanthera guangdongensis TaxID=2320717 RepID=A0ABR2LPB7_9ASPA